MKVSRFLFFLICVGISWFLARQYFNTTFHTTSPISQAGKERITLILDGSTLSIPYTEAKTIADLLQELRITSSDKDFLWPPSTQQIISNLSITLNYAKNIRLKTDSGTRTFQTQSTTIDGFLTEQNITLDEDDIVLPLNNAPLTDQLTLQIIRVTIKETVVNQPIPFTTQENEDVTLSWRKKIVTQKGTAGNKALTYKIVSHDGKEIQRKLLKTEITQQPVSEIVTQGTLVQTGKSHTGLGSWYAFTGTLSAANPWLPIGSYVRVTNQDNGKQVIVRINDRGPFGKNRIIDLDKVAFAKIASLGAGIINVKMDEITN